MKTYLFLKKAWLFWLGFLFCLYIALFSYIYIQTKNYNYTSNIAFAGLAFPNDAQSIRLAAYEDIYSSFNETFGGIYLFSTSFAYKRFPYE